jgi:CheY-like chemotaxis protein
MEDEEDVREIVAILLRLAGAEVTDVCDVEQALASYEQTRPDCIVSDLNLDHEGVALLETIRARPGETAPPAIAVTGRVFTEDRVRAMAAGYRTYLTKPVEPDVLVRAILEATGRSAPQ